ncbi:hypothetical protein C8R43DRAFT_507304 [Mycena crocata]|nr:hypothetical protein C8R43DRAFT_507304 [Mycena crocata]
MAPPPAVPVLLLLMNIPINHTLLDGCTCLPAPRITVRCADYTTLAPGERVNSTDFIPYSLFLEKAGNNTALRFLCRSEITSGVFEMPSRAPEYSIPAPLPP